MRKFIAIVAAVALFHTQALADVNGHGGGGGATPPPGGGGTVITDITSYLTVAACSVNTTTATACANWFQHVDPRWVGGSGACVTSGNSPQGDIIPALVAAESLAFTINPSAGLPIKMPNGKVCQKQGRWQIQHDGVTVMYDPQDIVYDGGSHVSDSGYIQENTGFSSPYYTNGNCAIDLNGHHNLSFKHANIHGDGAQQGTVEFCNSYISQPGDQLPTITFDDGSISLMGAAAGGPINTTTYTGSATGTCTGSLCGALITFRSHNSIFGENGWAFNGNQPDLFLDDMTVLNADGCGGITSFGAIPDYKIGGARIEAIGIGLSNVCPAGGAGVDVNGPGWTLTGVQFEINAGPDMKLSTGWGNLSVVGGHMLGGGTTATTGKQSGIYVASANVAGSSGATFSGVDFRKFSSAPKYAIEFGVADAPVTIFGGNGGAGAYTTAFNLFDAGVPKSYHMRGVNGEHDFTDAITSSTVRRSFGGL